MQLLLQIFFYVVYNSSSYFAYKNIKVKLFKKSNSLRNILHFILTHFDMKYKISKLLIFR